MLIILKLLKVSLKLTPEQSALTQCCLNVVDGGPGLQQRWINVSG